MAGERLVLSAVGSSTVPPCGSMSSPTDDDWMHLKCVVTDAQGKPLPNVFVCFTIEAPDHTYTGPEGWCDKTDSSGACGLSICKENIYNGTYKVYATLMRQSSGGVSYGAAPKSNTVSYTVVNGQTYIGLNLLNDPMILGGIAAVALIGIGAGFLLWRRRSG